MAGQWRPKHKCECPACGWKGKRTDFTRASKPCPQCGHFPTPHATAVRALWGRSGPLRKVIQGESGPGHCAQCRASGPDLAQVNPRHGWGAAVSYGRPQHWCATCRKELKGQWRWTPLERFRRNRKPRKVKR